MIFFLQIYIIFKWIHQNKGLKRLQIWAFNTVQSVSKYSTQLRFQQKIRKVFWTKTKLRYITYDN